MTLAQRPHSLHQSFKVGAKTSALFIAAFAVLVALVWHISVGARAIPISAVFNALFHFEADQLSHLVVRDMRLPRALMALFIGAGLSVSGALMQGVTRNPLADPGLLGLLSGASFAVVFVVGVFGWSSPALLPLVAAAGSLGASALVWFIASRSFGGLTPLSLTLAGAVITLFLGALISISHLLNQDTFDQLRVWLAGTLNTQRTHYLPWVLPAMLGALMYAVALAPRITVFAMGDQSALSLGINTHRLRLQCLLIVIVLTASSVTLAGPIGFVGLVIPHVTRLLIGSDYRWVIPMSALIGAAFLLGVDTLARTIFRPQEIATGIVTALIGAPLFIYLVARRAST